jgi:hypothetical protein
MDNRPNGSVDLTNGEYELLRQFPHPFGWTYEIRNCSTQTLENCLWYHFNAASRGRIVRLSMNDGDTQGAMGRLPLIPGMPVILTHNVATELGLTNGTSGSLVGVVYDDHDRTAQRGGLQPSEEVELYLQPRYLLVHFPDAQLLEPLPGLPANVVPVFPHEKNFRIRKGKRQGATVWRKQFPLVPGRAVTDYKTQGLTLDAAIADLVRAPHTKRRSAASIYVPVSRVHNRDELLLLRPFTKQDVFRLPDERLVVHIDQLRALAHQTIKAAQLRDSSLSVVLRRFETASAAIDNARKQRKAAMRRVDADRLGVGRRPLSERLRRGPQPQPQRTTHSASMADTQEEQELPRAMRAVTQMHA